MRLKQRDEFWNDLREITLWYEASDFEVSERFLAEIRASIEQILKHPLAWPVYRGDIRKYLVQEFPFIIFYMATEDTVTALAVVHASRRPGFWMERLKNES
jgi:plasmid stabilization system protein ParE